MFPQTGKTTRVLQPCPRSARLAGPGHEGGPLKGALGEQEVSGSYLGLE